VVAEGACDQLTVALAVFSRPETDHSFAAYGKGKYNFEDIEHRLHVFAACIDVEAGTVTAWGPAQVKCGSFKGGTLVRGDKAYGVLSLKDDGDGTVSTRAGIAASFAPELMTMIAEQCEGLGSFPATGPGDLNSEDK
jgi:hypothetical protein